MKNLFKLFALSVVAMLLVASCYNNNPWGNLPPFAIPGIEPDDDQDTGIDSEPGAVSTVESIEIVNGSAEISLNASPAGENSSTLNATTVSIPESVVGSAEKVKLTVVPYDIENAQSFILSDSDCVVGAINISMELDSRKVSEFSEPVTITTYIAQGLTNVQVKYNGSGDTPMLISYDNATGKIVFTTTHFSVFYIVSDSVVAYVPETNTVYATLKEAIDEAQSGATIMVLRNSSGEGLGSIDGNQTRESLIIDFAGHEYTMLDPAVGSTGTETQAMHWGTSLGSITMKNGTFKVEEDTTSVLMAMQNYIDFTAENMYFDFSNIPVVNYGENEFTGQYEEYNGLEVPMFNNNKGEMYLKDCTVIMPTASTKGVSAGGDFVKLENTTINGYVNLQYDTDKLIVLGTTTFNDVVSYFNGGEVTKTVSDDGITTYQLANK